jgi:hypothetical protein
MVEKTPTPRPLFFFQRARVTGCEYVAPAMGRLSPSRPPAAGTPVPRAKIGWAAADFRRARDALDSPMDATRRPPPQQTTHFETRDGNY